MHLNQTLLIPLLWLVPVFAASNFVNFETAPVHGLAFSPERKLLAVCNLPDGQVEIFSVADEGLRHTLSIPVGLDPISVRFRGDSELWVVNALSDSINVIDLENYALVRVIQTQPRPADVVFAGNPQRVFVSCPPNNLVQVFDPASGEAVTNIVVDAERPKSLAASPDGLTVYAAIFESGNGTTILAPRFAELGHAPPAGPVDLPVGPHQGANPPPNSGDKFSPAISTNLATPPRVSLVVRKQKDGRWLDDSQGNWTEFVSGTNAASSGRVPGWDLVDHDVAAIDAATFGVTYSDRLMNICADVAPNPQTGVLAVIGTDAINEVRYEPVLKSIFVRAELALVGEGEPLVVDLNPHLDYRQKQIPMSKRSESVGDPRGAVWNSSGTRLYVSGMGSDNVAMFDRAGRRLAVSGTLPAGPTGMAFDRERGRLYVLCRFDATVAVLDGETLQVMQIEPFFDPTPEVIRKGRRHFYNTHETSGLGQASCASCHLDGRFDRLAWDLGSPAGEMKVIATNTYNFVSALPAVTNNFHPMKGPMVTQTLQDIIGHEPFHWRGDRIGLEEFNPTFTDLQGADQQLSDGEMQELEDFLATIQFPPNRLRRFDNSLSTQVILTNHFALGRGQRFKGDPLPAGNAQRGLSLFASSVLGCTECHSMPAGSGPDKFFKNGRWTAIPIGPKGEHHLGLAATPRSELLPFKVAQLRNLPEKAGANLNRVSRSGFGFLHDGRVDSLTRFLQDGFGLTDDQETADTIAFLVSFAGSDLPVSSAVTSQATAPGTSSLDAPAALGRQLWLTNDGAALDSFIARASSSTGRLDLIVRAQLTNVYRGWFYDPLVRAFRPDSQDPVVSRGILFSNVLSGRPALAMLTPRGLGARLALDRDGDGALNFEEWLAGTDPANPDSRPGDFHIGNAEITGGRFAMQWFSPVDRPYRLLSRRSLSEDWRTVETNVARSFVTTNSIPIESSASAYYAVEVLPQ